jgi:hypothetical protein
VLLPRSDGDSMTQEQFTTPLVTPALFMIFHAPASQSIETPDPSRQAGRNADAAVALG